MSGAPVEADPARSEPNDIDPAGETVETVIVNQFELTLLLPTQSFVEPPSPNPAVKSVADGFLELPLPVGFTDPIHELKQLITESPEGFWLGAFGLAPVFAEQQSGSTEGEEGKWGPWQRVQPPADATPAEAWRLTHEGVLGEFADLQNVFGLSDWKGKRRGLTVVPIAYTPVAASQHIIRLRDTLYSLVPTAPPASAYDPSSLAVQAGISLYTKVRAQVPGASPEEATADTKALVSAKSDSKRTHAFVDWHYEDLDALGYLQALQKDMPTKATACLKTLAASQWGPPPHARRVRGDLVYLTAVTLEGDAYEIVGSSYGFYVSNSNSGKYDPSPRKTKAASSPYHSLFELLSVLSPLFSKNLAAVLKAQNPPHVTPDIFATIQISHAIPAASHVVPRPVQTADPLRAQLAYLLTGASAGDQLPPARDWNEEFIQSKEMPKSTVAERLVRERCKQRVQADFVAAATKGALIVARGDIPPLNPNEVPEAHTFLHNNMLFTRAEDQLDSYSHVGGREAARLVASKDVSGLTLLERFDVDGLNTMPTITVDYLGERWVVQSLIPGLFKTKEGELDANGQPVVYPEGDADIQKAAAEARDNDKPFPSETTRNKDDYPPSGSFRIVYGGPSPDAPEDKVRASAYFHKLAQKVAEELHLAEHTVSSNDGSNVSLHTSVDVHGVAAPDGRSYMIDLARLHCTDVEFLEKDVDDKYPHRLPLLRSELVENYRDSKLKEWIEEKVRVAREKADESKPAATVEDELKEAAQDNDQNEKPQEGEKKPTTVIDASEYKLAFNPDAFVERKALSNGAKIEADEPESDGTQAVRAASQFLRDTIIPVFVGDYLSGLVTITDGFQLTKIMHRRGINMRYAGRIVDLALNKRDSLTLRGEPSKYEVETNAAQLKSIFEHEMLTRSAKHLLNGLLRTSHPYDHAAVIAHFFSCLLVPSSKPVAELTDLPAGATSDRTWAEFTPTSLQQKLTEEVKARFQYVLPSDFFTSTLLPRKVFRELAVRAGIQFELQEYLFDKRAPDSNSTDDEVPVATSAPKKKKKKAASSSTLTNNSNGTSSHSASAPIPKATSGVRADDVINIVPIVKAPIQRSALAEENFHSGHRYMMEGQIELGQDMMNDALSLYEQVFGTVHPESAARYHALGVVYNQLGNAAARKLSLHASAEEALRDVKPEQRAASAESLKHIMLPEPEVVRAEADTYFNSAVRVVRQSLIISERIHGIDSYETIQQYTDLAVLEHAIGNTEMALRLTLHTINLWAAVHGPAHPNIVNLLSSASSMIQTMPDFTVAGSLPILQECLKAVKAAFGEHSLQYASAQNNIGQAYGVMNEWDNSLSYIDASVKLYTSLLGAEAKETVEAQNLYKIVEDAKSREGQEQRARDDRLRRRFPRVMQIRDNKRLAATSSTSTAAQANGTTAEKREHGQKADLSVDELVSFIQGTPPAPSKGNRKRKGSPEQQKK